MAKEYIGNDEILGVEKLEEKTSYYKNPQVEATFASGAKVVFTEAEFEALKTEEALFDISRTETIEVQLRQKRLDRVFVEFFESATKYNMTLLDVGATLKELEYHVNEGHYVKKAVALMFDKDIEYDIPVEKLKEYVDKKDYERKTNNTEEEAGTDK